MSTSFQNNENINILNSIILNNYSIQNVFISPSNFNSNEKFPINTGVTFIQDNQMQNSFSPNPKVNIKKENRINSSNYINKNFTPMPKKKKKSKFINIKLEKDNKSKNNSKMPLDIIPKLEPIFTNSNPEGKHPKDSIKKNVIKAKYMEHYIKEKKSLKNSLSLAFYEPEKRSKSSLYNNSLQGFQKEITLISGPKNNLLKKKSPKNSKFIIEPKQNFNLKEFQFGEQIGHGTFGDIFSVKWSKNNKFYAMKKEILNDIEEIYSRKKTFKIIQKFIKNNDSSGIIKLYGNLSLKNNKIIMKDNNNMNVFIYYELMEKAERDWDNEIIERSDKDNYYSEKEILNIMSQLIGTLSLLQKNHITHRDIKPQNILIINGKYKLCDFGEIRVLERAGLIVQRIRGSELYMSPILFQGLHQNLIQVKHNTYKSDVFSLGMCLFYACSLTYSGVDSIREITDMKKIKKILFQYLNKRYSSKLILMILAMLEVNEDKRLNFIQLEEKLKLLL